SALRMYDEALVEYRAVIEINPESTDAPMFIGALLAEQKKYVEAAKYFERLAKNEKYRSPYLAWYYIGRIRAEEGGPEALKKAEGAFEKSLSLKPSFVDAVMALGQLYESGKRRGE